MAFLDKIERMISVANSAVDLGTKLKSSDLLSGINLGSVNLDNMSSIQSTIESTINGKVSELTNNITSSIDISEIENLANSVSIDDFDIGNISGLEGISFM